MFIALRGRECEPRPTANVTGGCRAYLLHASNTLVGLSLITWNVSGFIRKYTGTGRCAQRCPIDCVANVQCFQHSNGSPVTYFPL